MLNTTITHRTHPFLPPWPVQTLGPECLLLVEFLPTDEANIPVEPATSAAVGDANATEPAPPVAPVRSMCLEDNSAKPLQGHECSWGADVDAHRPPTKQFVESLRVKIQVLEEELARLHALNQEQARRAVGSGAPAPADGVLPGDETLPGQSRPAIPSIAPLSGDYAQQFSRLTPQNKHSAITAGVTGRPLGTIYQFIFNINPSVPPNEQPEAVQQSLVCDWHRYLPPLDDIQLTRLEHDTLLDRCFKYSSCWLMMVIPQFFLCDMLRALTYSQEPAEVEYYSPLLHCSLLAFATALSDDPLVKQRGQKFAERAKQLLDDSLRRPCLSLVQSLAILSEYHCGLGGKEQGYIYLGMSIRAVRALGLGKADFQLAGGASPTVIPDWYFWSIYCQDKVMSLELNTDYDLRSPDYPALELPRIDWDLDRCPWSGISAPMPVAASDQGCRLTQVLAESSKLAIIAESIPRGT